MLSDWKLIAVFTPLLFVIYQALTKTLPKGTSVFLVNAYASLIGAVFMLLIFFLTSSNKSIAVSGRVMVTALAIGLLISSGNFLIIKAYSLGAPQSIFTSLFYPILIVCSVAVGLIVWHEKLNAIQILGVVLSIVGVVLVGYFRK